MNRPYGFRDRNDPMDMVRHHYERVGFHPGIMVRQFVPYHLNHPPRVVQPHFPVYDFAEQAYPFMGADGDEIRTGLRIIVSAQTDGPAIVALRGVL